MVASPGTRIPELDGIDAVAIPGAASARDVTYYLRRQKR